MQSFKAADLNQAVSTSVDNTTGFIKKNKVLTGAIAGGAVGTFLFPIPVVGTLLGVWMGVKVAEKINQEHKSETEEPQPATDPELPKDE